MTKKERENYRRHVERHMREQMQGAGWQPVLSPQNALRLLDALDEMEAERDEARQLAEDLRDELASSVPSGAAVAVTSLPWEGEEE